MKKIIKLTLEVNLKAGVKYDEDAKVFVSYAPTLGIYSQGVTENKAKDALLDAIQSFLTVAYKNDLLEKCLHIAGFTPMEKKDLTGEKNQEYINITAETLLKEKSFKNVFDIPSASIPLTAVECTV